MWKVSLVLVFHRILLIIVALFAINQSLKLTTSSKSMLLPTSVLWGKFIEKTTHSPIFAESARLSTLPFNELIKQTRDPQNALIWMLVQWMKTPPGTACFIISNCFLLLFLWELLVFMGRLVSPDVAQGTAILVLLWPFHFYLSLGSSMAFAFFLATFAIREAFDNRWFWGGLALACLLLIDSAAFGVAILMVLFFIYYQRHFQWHMVLKNLFFWLLPSIGAFFWSGRTLPGLYLIDGSALGFLWDTIRHFDSRLFSLSLWPLWVSMGVVGIGLVITILTPTGMIYRLTPLGIGLIWLVFSTPSSLANRLGFAACCLGGIVTSLTPFPLTVTHWIFTGLGSVLVFKYFSAM